MNGISAERIQNERESFVADFSRLEKEVSKRFIGHDAVLREALVALTAGGHILLEGVPGLGKTLLARTIAQTVSGTFSRIQFTPDLIPADLVGTEVLVHQNGLPQFEFRKGPVFANFLLADEINRAAPKTQSALLEAMEENAVSVGGIRYPLAGLFTVVATQNPVEMEGTYPLPEAQLDRFFAKLTIPYPSVSELTDIFKKSVESDLPEISPVFSSERLLAMRDFARTVPVAPTLLKDVALLIASTCPGASNVPEKLHRFLRYGASPRAGRALLLAGKIYALIDGRYNVDKEDVRRAVPMVLRHRLVPSFEGLAEGLTHQRIIEILLERF